MVNRGYFHPLESTVKGFKKTKAAVKKFKKLWKDVDKISRKSKKKKIKAVQQFMLDMGFLYDDGVDGNYGQKTEDAIDMFNRALSEVTD